MDLASALLLLLAAIGAGALNVIVGAGTLITFPTLLALGVPPVLANVSNTVGLVPGSVAGAYAFRETLRGRWRLVARLVVASAIGGITGGVLLLALPSDAFEFVVPILLLSSGVLAALQPRVAKAVARRRDAAADRSRTEGAGEVTEPRPASVALLAAVLATGLYGGYFGAAQGVILLAVLGIFVGGDLTKLNGMKNVLAGVANLTSAVLFIVISDVDWLVAAIVAVGATIGGGLGGRYGRRLPAPVLRALVVAIAFAAAIWQWLT